MDPTITHNHHQLKKNVPELRSGDRVRVHQKIQEGGKTRIQIFEGLVIKTQHGRGINGTFTVRRISLGVGVEKCFPLHLPSIVKIEKIKSAKVRRAKLFYVRGLVGKKARRLKREKEDAKVWEDVIVAESDETQNSPPKAPACPSGRDQPRAEKLKTQNKDEITEKEENEENKETVRDKNEKEEDQPKVDEPEIQAKS